MFGNLWTQVPGTTTRSFGSLPSRLHSVPRGRCRAWALAENLRLPGGGPTLRQRGILRDVTEDDQGRVHVQLDGCGAGRDADEGPGTQADMEQVRVELIDQLSADGYRCVTVEYVTDPITVPRQSVGSHH